MNSQPAASPGCWAMHKLRFLWRFHLIHHTDNNVDVTTGLRHHPGDSLLRGIFYMTFIVISGAPDLDVDIIVNVQGDEPFVKKEPLEKLLQLFDDPSVQVASLMQVMKDRNDIVDPNFVKVVVDQKMNALFFSRCAIPYPRDINIIPVYYEHIGVYISASRH